MDGSYGETAMQRQGTRPMAGLGRKATPRERRRGVWPCGAAKVGNEPTLTDAAACANGGLGVSTSYYRKTQKGSELALPASQ